MHIDRIWVMLVVCAGFTMGALFGRFIQAADRRRAARAGLPDLRRDGKDIVIANRLDEELRLVKIAAYGGFALAFREDRLSGSDPKVEHWFKRSRECDHIIAPKGGARLRMLLKTSSRPSVVYLTFESSAGTLRREVVAVEMTSRAA